MTVMTDVNDWQSEDADERVTKSHYEKKRASKEIDALKEERREMKREKNAKNAKNAKKSGKSKK